MLADENLLEDDVFWALSDHLGTVRRLVDNAGNAIRDRIFSAWGQVIEDTNPTFAYPFAFTGREYDPETGLYYYRARYYDPHTGRFLSEDPLGFQAGDTNLSRYVFNSPLNYTDPSGMAWSWPLAAAGGAIGAGVAVIGYGIGAWLAGHEVTWKGAAAAAAGGFTAGFIAGGIAGAATGDPTALIGAGALAGLAGAGVQSTLHQYLENGTVNWTQVLVDMMFGAALGAISGGVSSLLPGAGQAVRSSVDDLFWPGGSMALALPGGGAVPAVAPVAGGLSPAAQSQLLGGLTAFSVGLQGGSGPEEHPPSPEPYRGATPDDVVAPRGNGGFSGHQGFELGNHPLQPVRNSPTTIGQRQFSGHALDQMQNRGIPPSVVENTIQNGVPFPGNRPGTQGFYDPVNNTYVIINSNNGNVITVRFGRGG